MLYNVRAGFGETVCVEDAEAPVAGTSQVSQSVSQSRINQSLTHSRSESSVNHNKACARNLYYSLFFFLCKMLVVSLIRIMSFDIPN